MTRCYIQNSGDTRRNRTPDHIFMLNYILSNCYEANIHRKYTQLLVTLFLLMYIFDYKMFHQEALVGTIKANIHVIDFRAAYNKTNAKTI